MLTLYSGGKGYPIQNDDYYIREIPGGLNEVIFNISIWDELYPLLTEEANIREGEGQLYLIKQIDSGAQAAKVVCQLDLDEWRSEMLLNYTNGSATVNQTISGILPNGWTIQDRALLNIRRTVEGNYTPFEVVQACQETYGVQVQFDNKTKAITLFFAENEKPLGAFATRDLNLKEINYKGKSTNFATRLYAYGKDGLSFASINDGKPYVDDNTYSSRVICAYWKDERYEVAENLLEDAKKNLAAIAVPQRSYDCNVVDLAATNPEMYGFQDFSMFSVITLIDDSKNARINHQVVERWNYPYYPEKNKVILSTVVPKIQSQIVQVQQQINNPNSNFQQIQQSKIDNATNWLTGADGYVIAVKDDNGTWKEILFLDTPSAETAKNVLRINTNGIGFSTNGVNGPYRNAWTIDGSLVADFITTGVLTANLIKAGVLQSLNGATSINMETGEANLTGNGTFGSIKIGDGAGNIAGEIFAEKSGKTYLPYLRMYDESGNTALELSMSGALSSDGSSLYYNPNFKMFDDDGNIVFNVASFRDQNGKQHSNLNLRTSNNDPSIMMSVSEGGGARIDLMPPIIGTVSPAISIGVNHDGVGGITINGREI
nr:MAG TPA: tail protein [Caudoviricetes sp.]